MAFIRAGLQIIMPLGSLGGVTRHKYGYITNDDAAAVETSGYFNAFAAFINTGDQVDVSGDIDGTPFMRSYLLTKNASTSVVTVTRSAATAIA